MNRLLTMLALALVLGVLLNAGSSAYSAWVSATNHRVFCGRLNSLNDEFQAVIALALTPAPGKKYTAAQLEAATRFEARSAGLLDKARC